MVYTFLCTGFCLEHFPTGHICSNYYQRRYILSRHAWNCPLCHHNKLFTNRLFLCIINPSFAHNSIVSKIIWKPDCVVILRKNAPQPLCNRCAVLFLGELNSGCRNTTLSFKRYHEFFYHRGIVYLFLYLLCSQNHKLMLIKYFFCSILYMDMALIIIVPTLFKYLK